MRLFVAIDISHETRAQVARVREALASQLALLRSPMPARASAGQARVRQPPRVTWVTDQAAHVTLRFIGEVDEPAAARVQEALTTPLAEAPFDMEWRSVERFPRAIWIGAGSGTEDAARLAGEVNRRLEPIIGAGEERRFTPHLTVGRIKEPGRGFDWARALASIDVGVTRSAVNRVVLYRSQISPKGPTYTALTSTPLHG